MHLPGPVQLIIILVIVLVLFGGRGKISQVMGDFAKGIKSFKKGMADDNPEDDVAVKTIDAEAEAVTTKRASSSSKKKTASRQQPSKS